MRKDVILAMWVCVEMLRWKRRQWGVACEWWMIYGSFLGLREVEDLFEVERLRQVGYFISFLEFGFCVDSQQISMQCFNRLFVIRVDRELFQERVEGVIIGERGGFVRYFGEGGSDFILVEEEEVEQRINVEFCLGICLLVGKVVEVLVIDLKRMESGGMELEVIWEQVIFKFQRGVERLGQGFVWIEC